MNLYPMIFEPRFVEKMWGGRSLQSVAGKSLPPGKSIGESWEIFDFPPGAVGADGRRADDPADGWTSVKIANGPLAGRTLHEVMLEAPEELLGRVRTVPTPHGPQFPLLIKFLDARQDLSVQVHPPERYARTHPGAFVKNECWFVLSSEPGSRILVGATTGTTRETFEASIKSGACESRLNAIPVRPGETFYLPSGTVHALGAGIVVAEVQTPSDTTYRVFDFNRVEPSTGKPRTLHVEPALDCIDFENDWKTHYRPASNDEAIVVDAPQFTLRRCPVAPGKTIDFRRNQMRVLIVVEGEIDIASNGQSMHAEVGTTILQPASVDLRVTTTSRALLLEAIAR